MASPGKGKAGGGDEVNVRFSVTGKVEYGLEMYVVGSVPGLGSWRPLHSTIMHVKGEPDFDHTGNTIRLVWECCVKLPRDTEIHYRFFVGKYFNDSTSTMVEVILWETNHQPRKLTTPSKGELQLPVAQFGTYDGCHTISHGWLANHCSIQLRFHSNPILMWRKKSRDLVLSIKCSPLDFDPDLDSSIGSALSRKKEQVNFCNVDAPLDGPPLCDRTAMVCYNLKGDIQTPASQPPTGCLYQKDDYLVFISRGFNQKHLGFQIDFFVHDTNPEPKLLGTAHLLPPRVQDSVFNKRVPIINLSHRPIGEVQVEMLCIFPLQGYNWSMEVSYQNHWKYHTQDRIGPLNVGHRGMGSSYRKVAYTMKENTIRSLYSAAKEGADFVEFDVLLTKDHIPVVYHDFTVCLSTAQRASPETHLLEMAVKDLNLHNLQSLRLYHATSGSEGVLELTENDPEVSIEDSMPFPTLERCLEQVDESVGFNIEVKFPQMLEDGENEMPFYFDLNPYIDRILHIVLQHGGKRKIIFSTFHADSCIMLHLKQNMYPVLFLSSGPTQRYTPYQDWRCKNFQNSINFAKAEGLLGVNFQAEGLLRDLSLIPYIHKQGLVLFVWGEDLNQPQHKETLKNCKVDALIFDRIGHSHPDAFYVGPAQDSIQEDSTTFSSV